MNKTWIKDGKFTALKEDELKKLSAEELGEYAAAKIEAQIKSLFADSQKGSVTRKELDDKIKVLNDDIAKMSNEEMKTLKNNVDKLTTELKTANDALMEQGTVLKALKETGKKSDGVKKTFRDAIKDAIMSKKDIVLTEKNDDDGKRYSLLDWFLEKGNQQTPVFTLKSAVDMLESNIVQTNVDLLRLTELDPQRVGIPLTIYPHVLSWMPAKNIKRKSMSIMVVYSYVDGSGTKTEGSASSKSSFLLKTVEFPAFYIATHFTLSDETLDDLDEVMDEIAIVAPDKILDKVDEYVLGTTGDDSTAIAGLFTANKHTDFDTSTYTDTTKNANMVDLIAKAKLQCQGNKRLPNVVIMNPSDIDILASEKDANDNSILDRRVKYDIIGNPAMVCGMRIMATTSITADTLAVVQYDKLMLGKRKDMTLEIGRNADDLTKGQKTVVIKIRLAFGVRDKAAVIYSDGIQADIAAIDKSDA